MKDWVTIQDVGGSKGFRGICALRVPYLGMDDTLNVDPYQSCRLAALWQSFWQYFPKNVFSKLLLTNKQTEKNLATQIFEFSTLAFLAQCSNPLSYRDVLIGLLI